MRDAFIPASGRPNVASLRRSSRGSDAPQAVVLERHRKNGNDLVEGRGGADLIPGDGGNDTVSYASSPAAVENGIPARRELTTSASKPAAIRRMAPC
jgi:hypothetical protein